MFLHRFVASLLAVTLLCAGLTVPDRLLLTMRVAMADATKHAQGEQYRHTTQAPDHDDRSDDLSPQPHADALHDLTGLIDVTPELPMNVLTMMRPRQLAQLAYPTPFLARPQRPPCAPRTVA